MILHCLHALLALLTLILVCFYGTWRGRTKYFEDLPIRLRALLETLLKRPEEMQIATTSESSYQTRIDGEISQVVRFGKLEDGLLGKMQLAPDSFAILSGEDILTGRRLIGSQSQLCFLRRSDDTYKAEVLPYSQRLSLSYRGIPCRDFQENSGRVAYHVRFASLAKGGGADLQPFFEYQDRIERHARDVLTFELSRYSRREGEMEKAIPSILEKLNEGIGDDLPFQIRFTAMTIEPRIELQKERLQKGFGEQLFKHRETLLSERARARSEAQSLVQDSLRISNKLNAAFADLRGEVVKQSNRETQLQELNGPVEADTVLNTFPFLQGVEEAYAHRTEDPLANPPREIFVTRLEEVRQRVGELKQLGADRSGG